MYARAYMCNRVLASKSSSMHCAEAAAGAAKHCTIWPAELEKGRDMMKIGSSSLLQLMVGGWLLLPVFLVPLSP